MVNAEFPGQTHTAVSDTNGYIELGHSWIFLHCHCLYNKLWGTLKFAVMCALVCQCILDVLVVNGVRVF